MNIEIVKLRSDAILPGYQTEHAAGMDLHACLDAPKVLEPMERAIIATGIAVAVPVGYEAQVRARSGLSIKHGVTVVNGVGTVDSDYRGEVGVLVVNLGKDPFIVEPGMRIAQMVIARHERASWQLVEALAVTDRGTAGYGSTGK
ncbi:TPA: dUTP diphosphatase [Candidatus Saccharibacteria bacterium]|nr:MAG: dut, Deoxyuridine 5'-triphosphate nucleotidohydrolase [Candidatus Saccharibacteria bacterium GW2011_GWC2_44_17]OGL33523.1 MAG: deoxyuridine 5'-triphosphate nucleotidohydrolase [Candidatus Saccharibacteria bacterium RIFCSPHIGHO2_12_FULL_47_16]HBH77238.1 dUTP diphosphatase [Candidatus Saccharibacteria bacterium]